MAYAELGTIFFSGMLYAVCTQCAFLRVFAAPAEGESVPESCPACGGDLYAASGTERFEPTYIARTSLELHSTPTIAVGSGNPSLPPPEQPETA